MVFVGGLELDVGYRCAFSVNRPEYRVDEIVTSKKEIIEVYNLNEDANKVYDADAFLNREDISFSSR